MNNKRLYITVVILLILMVFSISFNLFLLRKSSGPLSDKKLQQIDSLNQRLKNEHFKILKDIKVQDSVYLKVSSEKQARSIDLKSELIKLRDNSKDLLLRLDSLTNAIDNLNAPDSLPVFNKK